MDSEVSSFDRFWFD